MSRGVFLLSLGLKKGVAQQTRHGVGVRVGDVAAPVLRSGFHCLQVRRRGGNDLGRVAVAVGNRGGRVSLQ